MKFDFIPEKITAKDGSVYYGIFLVLKQDGQVVRRSKVLMWIDESQFDSLTSSK